MLVVFLPFLLDVADYGRSVFQESREEIGKESLQSVDVMQVLEEIQNQKSQWSGSETEKQQTESQLSTVIEFMQYGKPQHGAGDFDCLFCVGYLMNSSPNHPRVEEQQARRGHVAHATEPEQPGDPPVSGDGCVSGWVESFVELGGD